MYATCSTPEAAHYCSLSEKNEAVHSACPVKYDELLQAGYDFVELVAVHGSSMELVEIAALMDDRELPLSRKPSNKTFIIVTNQSTLCTSYIHEMLLSSLTRE